MIGRANQPRDLVWSLESFKAPDTAIRFFELFQNRFMVYSKAVEKIYCEYDTHLTGPSGRRRLVVLPDFNQYEAIFNRIGLQAIEETSIHIYPTVQNQKTRLMLSGQATSTGELARLPLRQGLRALKMGYFDNRTIIPTLMLGDLREFPEKRLPYLKLHSVNTDALDQQSDFERSDIAKSAWTRLNPLC
ncbi:hypothetical protein [Reinekea blandensis]|uniref:Uncharacterized protein n=1 Tax=Reinekea blandensis MED297 TaxID=314283 RepID=A4BE60_9GAMM|nr:hypothetical protein [Reinekea blandensis]EAR09538.1 hypothetical protein MED297_12442 [Reinekea blandensis MED297]